MDRDNGYLDPFPRRHNQPVSGFNWRRTLCVRLQTTEWYVFTCPERDDNCRHSLASPAIICLPTTQLLTCASRSGAAGLIYGYTFVIPVILFLALRYFGSESANLLECWALYGYSNLIWIPVALISWSPISILNFIFVAVGFAVSVAFLLRNLYPVLSATDRQTSKILLILVLALHAGLAIAIKILFFAQGSPVAGDGGAEAPEKPDTADRFF